jgi:HAMP domain-containing protein
MEESLREIEVSIWEMLQAVDSFRFSGHDYYSVLYDKQIKNIDVSFLQYKTFVDTEKESLYAKEFEDLFKEVKVSGSRLIELARNQKKSEEEFFVNVDEADDVIDFALQTKWQDDDPNILKKEQAVREVEVSIWEAIHAAQQYTGLAGIIVRGGQEYLEDRFSSDRKKNAEEAGAAASLVKGDFKDLMESQFNDVEKYWSQYKSLPHDEFEELAISKFDSFWKKAMLAGKDVIHFHDLVLAEFNVLYEKISSLDDILDFKMQQLVKIRVEKEDILADRIKRVVFMIVLFSFIISVFMGIGISRSIAVPIMKLRDSALEIGNGKLDVRADIRAKGEIGFLVTAFNDMVDQLSAGEQQIRAREQQLKAYNEQLKANEQSLIKAQNELEMKIRDLELYKEITVGRELKMITLKREINAILKEFGREPKYDIISEGDEV